jgi:hypothetical protein
MQNISSFTAGTPSAIVDSMPIKSCAGKINDPVLYSERVKKGQSPRRLSLLESMGMLRCPDGVTLQRAFSFKDLRTAYTLCYRIFLANQYLEPNFMGMRLREWELRPEAATFVARAGRRIVGVSSLAADLPGTGLPSEWLFADELALVRRTPGSIAEVCNGAVANEFRNSSIPFEMVRCLLATAWKTGIRTMFAVANRAHRAFYELCYAVKIGDEKSYSDRFYDPVVLMLVDCDDLYAFLSSPESDNDTADGFLRRYLLLENPYVPLAAGWDRRAKASFRRQRIGDRFQDEIRNTLVASVFE